MIVHIEPEFTAPATFVRPESGLRLLNPLAYNSRMPPLFWASRRMHKF